jgi:glutathione synthase/RimK-type ligase-like ATP-grasp enzyme
MIKPILVITDKCDVHADFVTIELRKLGGDIVRMNTQDMGFNSDFTLGKLDLAEPWKLKFHFKDSDKTLTSDSFDTIWYRKPEPVEPDPSITEEHAQVFVKEEYNYFLRSFYNLYSHKIWVNPFWNLRHASQKLPNLELAVKLGLKVPKTLITNNPEVAREFGEHCHWNLLVKTFHFSGFVVNQTEAWHCFAKHIDKEQFLQFAETINFAPTFLQQYIDKSIELRVTIIGEEVFTAAIHSQEIERTKSDWRAIDSYQIKHTVYDLPVDIAQKLLAFNRHYSLVFSTFDLILTPEGEYYFLECNPNGQWYWIEELTQIPMAKTMAKLLMSI